MIKDRLPDLKLLAIHSRTCSEDGDVCIQLDKPSDEITEFLDKAQQIHFAIDVIRTNTDEIKKLHSIILSLPHGKEQNNSEVEDRKTAICHTIRQIKKQLQEIETDVMDVEEDESTLSRIKKIQLSTLVTVFADATRAYNETLIKHQERCKAIMHQQLKILNKTAVHDELEALLEKEEGTHLFVDNIIADTLEAQLALANVKARHEDLIKIENSVREVRDLFTDMATLVETQGDNILRIEHHVQKATEYADRGQSQLEKTKKRQKRAMKRNRILLIILVIVFGIIAILLLI